MTTADHPAADPLGPAKPSVEGEQRLTHAQELIWAGQALQPESPLYNMALAFEISGPFDVDRFDTAFQEVLDNSDALRSLFDTVDGRGVARVCVPFAFRSERVDLSAHERPAEAAGEWMRTAASRALDLTSRAFESAIVHLGPDRHIWFLNQHHLITDAWSSGLVFRRTAEAYDRLSSGAPTPEVPTSEVPTPEAPTPDAPTPKYRDFVEFLEEFVETRPYKSAREHWAAMGTAERGPAALYGSTRSAESMVASASERLTLHLGAERSARIKASADLPAARGLTEHASRFNVFAALVLGYVARVSGQKRVALSAPAHNRPTQAFKDTIGLFIEMYPLDAEVGPDTTFRDLLGQVKKQSASFLRYAQPGTSDGAVNRSVNVVLNYINATFSDFAGLPTRSEWIHSGYGDAGHDLRVQIHDFDNDDDIVVHFDLSADRFDAAERDRSLEHFVKFVDAALESPDSTLTTLEIVDDDEVAQLRIMGAAAIEAEGQVPTDVVAAIRAQTRAHPDRVAVRPGQEREWSYLDLRKRALAIASRLEALDVRGRPVLMAVPRSAEAIAAMLAVLEAGGCYVPLDPDTPPERMQFVASAVQPAALVASREQSIPVDLPRVEADVAPLSEADVNKWDARRGGADSKVDEEDLGKTLAYVLFTSGSTGDPKGVEVTRASLANYAQWAAKAYLPRPTDSMALFTPLTFDLTVTSVFAPLVSGRVVHVYEDPGTAVDTSVMDVFSDDATSVVKLTPSHLTLVSDQTGQRSTIRTLVLGGEELTVELAQRAQALLPPEGRIINEYGPTEATVACTAHPFDPDADRGTAVPIGRPIAGATIAVTEPCGRLAPTGVVGEIVVGGPGVARGYMGLPEETAKKFVPDPFVDGARAYRTGDLGRWRTDGTLEYRGRRDRQLKVHGIRVEPAEIEQAVLDHPAVTGAVVLGLASTATPAATPSKGDDRACLWCGIAANHPDVELDQDSICSLCRAFAGYQEGAQAYFGSMEELESLLHTRAEGTGDGYDCIMLLSGGKDSSYALYRLVNMGLKVLAVTLDNGFISDGAKANIRRITEHLDVAHEYVMTEAMNAIFADSLDRFSNVCQGCFKTMYVLAFNLALDRNIPSVVTGLSVGQFFETRLTEELFVDQEPTKEGLELVVLDARKAYHRTPDFVNRTLDTQRIRDDAAFEQVEFVDFYRYCDVPLSEMLDFLDAHAPWIRPADTGRSTNCLINDVGIFVHQQERGYHNYALPYSWDVRLGHKERAAALEELDDEIDLDRVQAILDEIGYTPKLPGRHPGDRRLVAVVSTAEALDSHELRGFLKTRLPSFMIPSQVVQVDKIPINARGKVDVRALEVRVQEQASSAKAVGATPPETPTEATLSGLWAEALGLPGVGTEANFFDLGGDSITAIRLAARAMKAGLAVTPNDLFRHQTIRGLAEAVDARTPGTEGSVPTTVPAPTHDVDEQTLDKVAALLRRADGK